MGGSGRGHADRRAGGERMYVGRAEKGMRDGLMRSSSCTICTRDGER